MNVQPDTLVMVHVPVTGGVCLQEGGEIEISLPKNAIARVVSVENLSGRQGWAVTVVFDNGIVNVFDQGDPEPRFPFTLMDPSDHLNISRIAFLLNNSPADYPPDELLRDIDYILTGERS